MSTPGQSIVCFNPSQSQVVFYQGDALAVLSRAGTGKTTMLLGFAKQNPNIPMLYICYNKSISEEAQKKFPSNVTCRTMHAIAYARKGVLYKHKLTGNLRLADIKKMLELHDWEDARVAMDTLNGFLSSASTEIDTTHVPQRTPLAHKKRAVLLAQKLWTACIDPEHPMQMTHDMYLKLYCLEPADLHRWFAVILFDEAQDSNPVVSDYLYRQSCRHIVVGDEHQQLYRWRGADNSMADFIKTKKADVVVVNTSFRFGATIAKVASTVLAYKSNLQKSPLADVLGNEKIQDQVFGYMPSHWLKQRHTKLHRTVAGTIKTALDNIDKRIYWVGGIEAYNLQEVLDVYYFSTKQHDKIKRTKLRYDYKDFSEYKVAAKSTADLEMGRIVRMLDEHGPSLVRKLQLLQKNSVKTESEADLVISTSHRSKGLEWEFVVLADDFPDFLADTKGRFTLPLIADELNLLYVACTRAIKQLVVNTVVLALDRIVHTKQSPYIDMGKVQQDIPQKTEIKRLPYAPGGSSRTIQISEDD